MLRTGSSVSSY